MPTQTKPYKTRRMDHLPVFQETSDRIGHKRQMIRRVSNWRKRGFDSRPTFGVGAASRKSTDLLRSAVRTSFATQFVANLHQDSSEHVLAAAVTAIPPVCIVAGVFDDFCIAGGEQHRLQVF